MKPAPLSCSVRSVQCRHDYCDSLCVPTLHGFMIRAQSSTQAPPGVQVPVRNRMDQTACAYDPSQDITAVLDISDPGHCFIHPVNFVRRRHCRPDSRSAPPVRFQRSPNDLDGGTPYPRRPPGAWKRQQRGTRLLQSIDHVISINRTIEIDRTGPWPHKIRPSPHPRQFAIRVLFADGIFAHGGAWRGPRIGIIELEPVSGMAFPPAIFLCL